MFSHLLEAKQLDAFLFIFMFLKHPLHYLLRVLSTLILIMGFLNSPLTLFHGWHVLETVNICRTKTWSAAVFEVDFLIPGVATAEIWKYLKEHSLLEWTGRGCSKSLML